MRAQHILSTALCFAALAIGCAAEVAPSTGAPAEATDEKLDIDLTEDFRIPDDAAGTITCQHAKPGGGEWVEGLQSTIHFLVTTEGRAYFWADVGGDLFQLRAFQANELVRTLEGDGRRFTGTVTTRGIDIPDAYVYRTERDGTVITREGFYKGGLTLRGAEGTRGLTELFRLAFTNKDYGDILQGVSLWAGRSVEDHKIYRLKNCTISPDGSRSFAALTSCDKAMYCMGAGCGSAGRNLFCDSDACRDTIQTYWWGGGEASLSNAQVSCERPPWMCEGVKRCLQRYASPAARAVHCLTAEGIAASCGY